jgi:hypothetical protein
MSLLIYSGLLYLVGISIVLAFKPLLMFSKDGNWKEFGIGRSKERYTWMPFWLFAILWAIVSYTIVLVIVGNEGSNQTVNVNTVKNNRSSRGTSNKRFAMAMNHQNNNTEVDADNNGDGDAEMDLNEAMPVTSMKNGYYVVNRTGPMKNGKLQYVYLGPHAPNLQYEDGTF